jgi:hypothetical protein
MLDLRSRLSAALGACLITLALSAGTASAFSPPRQPPDGCPAPSAAVFDLALPPAPSQSDPHYQADAANWTTLRSSSGGLAKAMFNDDASQPYITYTDAQLVQNQQAGKNLQVGIGTDLPPSGPVPGVDYIVGGTIAGQEGAYTLSAFLEDAQTRATLARSGARTRFRENPRVPEAPA